MKLCSKDWKTCTSNDRIPSNKDSSDDSVLHSPYYAIIHIVHMNQSLSSSSQIMLRMILRLLFGRKLLNSNYLVCSIIMLLFWFALLMLLLDYHLFVLLFMFLLFSFDIFFMLLSLNSLFSFLFLSLSSFFVLFCRLSLDFLTCFRLFFFS